MIYDLQGELRHLKYHLKGRKSEKKKKTEAAKHIITWKNDTLN